MHDEVMGVNVRSSPKANLCPIWMTVSANFGLRVVW